MKKIKWSYYYPSGRYSSGQLKVPTGYLDWIQDPRTGKYTPFIREEPYQEDWIPGWSIGYNNQEIEIIWMEVDE